MKYCSKCGNRLETETNFCPNCGNSFVGQVNETETSSGSVTACAIIGLLFPIIGAILYYALKNTNIKAAKTANVCSWLGFLWQVIAYFTFFKY